MNPDVPVWHQAKMPHFGTVRKALKYDVVIVGGGITGLTAAYLLKKAGKCVCVLERDRIASGDTSHTTAHLTYVTDQRISDLSKNFGKDGARLVLNGGEYAINLIESICADANIDCEFRRVPAFLLAALHGEDDESVSLKEDSRVAVELGFSATFLDAVPYFEKPGVRFADQAKFHPLRYLAGLARAVEGDGCSIFENSEVSEVQAEPSVVTAQKHKIECDYLVIATHVPLMGITGLVSATLFQTKLYPHSSYVIGAKVPKGTIPEASFWDTSDPYYYLRVDRHATHDYVIFGGEDHKTGQADQTAERFDRLKSVLLEFVPQAKVDRHWSGQVIETNDGLPYIGESTDRQFTATGFSGNGMTFGTLAGMMACDAALGRANPWKELFAVNRKKVRAGAWEYITENFDFPYYFVKDRLWHSEGTATRSVKRGEGKILTLDGERAACSRDESGKLSKVSAVCTHMGCLVRWNTAERTWDCPCHGSRFHTDGSVLAGPAEDPLASLQTKTQKAKKS